jgi:hypothetical protein
MDSKDEMGKFKKFQAFHWVLGAYKKHSDIF